MTLTNDLEQGHVFIGQHPCHGGHSGKPNVGFIFAALACSRRNRQCAGALHGHALGHAPASTLAPFNYGTIVIATILGYFVFHQFPDQWTIVGATVIIASGLYVIHRETVRHRERQQGA